MNDTILTKAQRDAMHVHPAYQRAVGDFVHREVHYCVSTLVHDLFHMLGDSGSEYEEELHAVSHKYDYEEAADWHASNADIEDLISCVNELYPDADLDVDEVRDYVLTSIQSEDTAAQKYCEHFNIDPDPVEAYEHWIVTDWLADRLAERGGMVTKDLHGMTVWGRTTTGQAIAMDGIIESIFDEIRGHGFCREHNITGQGVAA